MTAVYVFSGSVQLPSSRYDCKLSGIVGKGVQAAAVTA